jgi:hypothetical protein
MFNRIRIITTEGHIEVRDRSFSQTVEMLNGLDKDARDGFWNKQETKLVDGSSVYLVREGV